MDNAKKLIPESYKVDGKEFEMTDGNETYRVKWSSSINEGIVLTSSNKAQINEDMGKMKHLMGFKSQETLGTVKGADRLDENKKFGNILGKSKNLLNEGGMLMANLKTLSKYLKSIGKENASELTPKEEEGFKEYIKKNEPKKEIEEGEHIKSGMGGSNKGKSRTDKTEVLKKDSKKKRRKADKEATKDINENDVEAFQSALGDSPKVAAAAKKVNTRDEKFEAAIAYINNMVGDNDVLKSKIARTLLKKDGSDVVNEFDGDEDEYEYYRRGGRELDDYLDDAEKEAKKAKESGIFKDDLPPGPSDEEEQAAQVYEDDLPIPPGPSDEEEQAAQVYEDRFDEVFEGIYENVSEDVVEKFVKYFSNPELLELMRNQVVAEIREHLEYYTEGHEYSDGPGEGGGIDFKITSLLDFDSEMNFSNYEFLPKVEGDCWKDNQSGRNCQVDNITIPEIIFYGDDGNEVVLNPSRDERIRKVINKIESIFNETYKFLSDDEEIKKWYEIDDYRDDYERYGVSRSDFFESKINE